MRTDLPRLSQHRRDSVRVSNSAMQIYRRGERLSGLGANAAIMPWPPKVKLPLELKAVLPDSARPSNPQWRTPEGGSHLRATQTARCPAVRMHAALGPRRSRERCEE